MAADAPSPRPDRASATRVLLLSALALARRAIWMIMLKTQPDGRRPQGPALGSPSRSRLVRASSRRTCRTTPICACRLRHFHFHVHRRRCRR